MTRKFFLNETAETNSIHSTSLEELGMNETIGTPTTKTVAVPAEATINAMVWTTPSGVPDESDMPNGTWEFSLNVSELGSNVTLSLTGANGHIAVVNSAASSHVDSKAIVVNITGTGITTDSVTWDPISGSASDRLAFALAATNVAMHGDENAGIETADADSFFETPLSVGPTDTFHQNLNINQAVNRAGTY